MPRADDPTLNRRRLRIELRRAREKAGLTQHEAAGALEWSLSKIIRIETGTVSLSVTDLRAMLSQYGVTDPDLVANLENAARKSKGQSWWAPYSDIVSPQFGQYLGYEAAAAAIRTYHPICFPGALQTTDYATALLELRVGPERAQRIVELRAARQERLYEEDGPEVSFVVDEAALRRQIGGPGVMRQQLRHVKQMMTDDSRVHVRVLPFTAGAHYSTLGSFLLLGFEDDEDLVYVEAVSGSLASRDDHELIARYQECFEQISDRALSKDASLALIDKAVEDFSTS